MRTAAAVVIAVVLGVGAVSYAQQPSASPQPAVPAGGPTTGPQGTGPGMMKAPK